jgi:hypothetical protein
MTDLNTLPNFSAGVAILAVHSAFSAFGLRGVED